MADENNIHRRYITEEIQALSKYKSEIDDLAVKVILSVDIEDIIKWSPTKYERLSYAIRASLMSMMGMILYDLDGSELDEWWNPDHYSIFRAREHLADLVREARGYLVDAILCIPETVVQGNPKGESIHKFSIGGFDNSGVDLDVVIKNEDICGFKSVETGNDRYCAILRWELANKLNRIARLASFVDSKVQINSMENVLDCMSSIEEAYSNAPIKSHLLSDDDIKVEQVELVKKAVEMLVKIESMMPLYSQTYCDMAQICYQLAKRDPLPEWLENIEAVERENFPYNCK